MRLLQQRIREVQKPVPIGFPKTMPATANVVARVAHDSGRIQRRHGRFRDGLFT